MADYIDKAKELGQAVLESEQYVEMRLAEEAAMHDKDAAMLVAAVAEQRKIVEGLLASASVDASALSAEGAKLQEMEKAMKENPVVKNMSERRAAFSQMMNDINAVLRYVINGDDPDTESDSCGGDCSSCGGCH